MTVRKPKIVELIQAGLTAPVIAKQQQCTVNYVRNVAVECGLKVAPANRYPYVYSPNCDVKTEIILEKNLTKYVAIIRESRT